MRIFRKAALLHFDALTLLLKPCRGPGVHAAHPVVDVGSILGEMELRHLFGQRRGQRGLGLVLFSGLQFTSGDLFQRRDQRPGANGADAVEQLAAGLLGVDGYRLDQQHIAGVKALVELHDGNAGPGIAIEHRPLNGRRTAVLRQQRHMQIDAAVLGHMQKLRRDDAAVSHHHDDIGCQFFDDIVRGTVPQCAGLVDRDAMLGGQLLDRRCR